MNNVMQTTTELDPDIARHILANASQKGLPVDIYLKNIIDEDSRLVAMSEAMKDELFLADLRDVAEDFKHIDTEQ
ncbi:MAG: hypothetical protein KF855_06905 [Acidobacteria bacterium]|nr:hypothetical protein [Acidobacteriota bacterium]